ncbi:unnamed protein product [Auanema sp. JU1783]|nr:unnamed protein product [Auanema sp. JU1783]
MALNFDEPVNTTNATTSSQDEMILGTMGTIEVAILICILCVGGPLNVLSFQKSLLAFRNHKAKSPILLLRINLNIADLITILVYVPRQIIWMLTYQWLGGELLCRLNSFFSTFSFYLISFIISCISIDRVYGAYNISSLTAHRQSYRRCRSLLTVAWVLAFFLSIPQVIIFRTINPIESFSQCVPLWTVINFHAHPVILNKSLPEHVREAASRELKLIQQIEHLYNVAHLFFVFWIPCTIIVVCYLTVLFILQGHISENNSCTSWIKSGKMHSNIDYPVSASSTMLPVEESSCVVKIKEECSMDSRCGNNSHQSRCSNRLGAVAVTTIHKAKQHAKRQAAWIILAYLTFWTPYNVLAVLSLLDLDKTILELNTMCKYTSGGCPVTISEMMMAYRLIILLAFISTTLAFPPGIENIPPPPRELPPGFAEILPSDVVQQLQQVHESDTMSPLEKHEKIDQILVNLPEDIADRLPKPPGFESLPQNVKDHLKDLHRDKSLTWRSRMDKVREYLSSQPEEIRRLLPPMGPPPPPGFGPARMPSFERRQ